MAAAHEKYYYAITSSPVAHGGVSFEIIKGYAVNRIVLERDIPDGYYYIRKRAATTTDIPACPSGWKIHLSIARKDVEKAWDAICPILIRHGVYQAKFRAMIYEHSFQAGKEIVIYAFKSPGLDWNQILNEIEVALNAARIPPQSAVTPCWRITVPAKKGVLGFRTKKEESIETDIPELAIRGSRFLYCEDDTPVETEAAGLAKIHDIIARADRGLFAGVIIEAAASATTAEATGVAMTASTFITPGCKPPSGDDEDSSGLEGINYGGGGGSG